MNFLYFLEGIRIPVLNECMLLITRLGEETAFLVMALIVFWCVDKYKGYYLMAVGFAGTMLNQFLKLLFGFRDRGFWIRISLFWNRRGKRLRDILFPVATARVQWVHSDPLLWSQRTAG